GPLPPVAHPQVLHLVRPVRRVRLRGLRPLHHLVPGRHRRHRGAGEPVMTPIPATDPPAPRSGPHPLTPVPYRVRSRVAERSDTVTLTLTPVIGACPPFTPGQFTMLYAPGVGEIPVSISGRARSGGLVQTIRAVGAVSTALCRMRPGDLVGVRGPYGTGFDLTAAAGRDVVVAAGGLGLAPLRPVIRELAAHRSRYGRVSVIVGAQVPKTLLYPRELDRWRDRHGI